MHSKSLQLNGQEVRRLRQSMGWNQENLAELANVSKRTIENIENGRSVMVSTAGLLATALGVTIEYLEQTPGVAVEHLGQDNKGSKGYADFTIWLLSIALAVTLPAFLIALFLGGWKSKTGFEISDTILAAMGVSIISEIVGLITLVFMVGRKTPSN